MIEDLRPGAAWRDDEVCNPLTYVWKLRELCDLALKGLSSPSHEATSEPRTPKVLQDMADAVEAIAMNAHTGADRRFLLMVAEVVKGAEPSATVTTEMVDRFLSWKLPEDFHPDAGISFSPFFNVEYNAKQGKPPQRHEPIGTNLLNADQARAMLEHVLGVKP